MIYFFEGPTVLAVRAASPLSADSVQRLRWLFSGAESSGQGPLTGTFVGPRRESITPWSTNAVEITQNMGLRGIERIEEFRRVPNEAASFDPMLQALYNGLDQRIFDIDIKPAPIEHIADLREYNKREGLALSEPEIQYLEGLAKRLQRPLTDSEVFGFSQVNSEHCRHKIFGGTFVIDGKEMPCSLFDLIKRTTKEHQGRVISAYKDNVAFLEGPDITQFAPQSPDKPSLFAENTVQSVLSLKAETHNFPTTVEPFNGAATGSGGEIRDRMGGGIGSQPLAGTAVYMTSYPRLHGQHRLCQDALKPRPWLYQTPAQILIKASNGASDFGNKFGQPLIVGSLLTFEQSDQGTTYAYDKVIMQAGGVGYARRRDALKKHPQAGQDVVLMGGDNYRIGMGGGAVSSLNTGACAGAIELNAVQRSNPEMQKRVQNVIRAVCESDSNPIVSIHDHGAGGHLNCLSELVEETGGMVDIDALPIGDTTLSDREIIGNESQERMGLVADTDNVPMLRRIAERERAPFYVIGRTTGDMRFTFARHSGEKAIDWQLSDMFGNPPKTVMRDHTVPTQHDPLDRDGRSFQQCLDQVLALEAVACKDWLTNKVDRSVTGRVARQQCLGPLQLPLSDFGCAALDFSGRSGMATSIGHAPAAALIDPKAGSILAAAEALTNLVGAPLKHGLSSVALSANWMWPCRQPGQDARLYNAVNALSEWTVKLGVNIPTGKDSLSMTQQYPDGTTVLSPGTVIISALGEVADVRRLTSPVLVERNDTTLLYIDFSGAQPCLGGTALAQALAQTGDQVPTVDPQRFASTFNALQECVKADLALALHDVSAGGLIVTLLEMTFANTRGGLQVTANIDDPFTFFFNESPAVVLQVDNGNLARVQQLLSDCHVLTLAHPIDERRLKAHDINLDIDECRAKWFAPSEALDALQTPPKLAHERATHLVPLEYRLPQLVNEPDNHSRPIAAIIREKGINGDREMAYTLFAAGFDVKDVHMTDLATGRETLDDVQMIVFCGGFSNSDVLGSAKGWAGAFKFNPKAAAALQRFYDRPDTLSLGVCNGCQLMMELGLLHPDKPQRQPHMRHNRSHKFESAFLTVIIPDNASVMFGDLAGTKLGVWVAHGEGRFELPDEPASYHTIARYNHSTYPANPNGSDDNVAGIASDNGRHVAIMPHPERAIFPWQCPYYPAEHMRDQATPWLHAFVNAREWCRNHKN